MNEIAKNDKNVEMIDGESNIYTKEFVKEIQKSRATKGKIIKPEDLWK